MQPVNQALGVLSGQETLRIGFDAQDIAYLCVGVFLAMLAALVVAKHL